MTFTPDKRLKFTPAEQFIYFLIFEKSLEFVKDIQAFKYMELSIIISKLDETDCFKRGFNKEDYYSIKQNKTDENLKAMFNHAKTEFLKLKQ
ncbi:hypothetical protein [Caudoviricetes sp.]|nr:hypothetical protein [Caudoviricetes sp.]